MTTAGVAVLGALFGFAVGIMAGTRTINVFRLHLWHRVDGLIYLIEQIVKASPDGRIDPSVMLLDLYSIKQELRIPKRQEV